MSFKPEDVTLLADRVLVRRIDTGDEVTEGGILIPEQAQEMGDAAEVIRVGSGALDADGNRVPIEVAPGDRVLISRYAGTEIKVDGASYLVLREGDILATVVEE